MLILSCILFLVALTAACFALLTSVTENIDRIIEVVEHRSGVEASARKIITGELRSPVSSTVRANVVELKARTKLPSLIGQEELRLAA